VMMPNSTTVMKSTMTKSGMTARASIVPPMLRDLKVVDVVAPEARAVPDPVAAVDEAPLVMVAVIVPAVVAVEAAVSKNSVLVIGTARIVNSTTSRATIGARTVARIGPVVAEAAVDVAANAATLVTVTIPAPDTTVATVTTAVAVVVAVTAIRWLTQIISNAIICCNYHYIIQHIDLVIQESQTTIYAEQHRRQQKVLHRRQQANVIVSS